MDKKEKDFTLAGFMGAIFIVIGFIGMVIIISSFDFETYNELNDSVYLDTEEEVQLQLLKDDLLSNWIIGIGTLVINLAIGVVLITLGKILRTLEDIRDKNNLVNKPKTSQ